MFVIKDMNGYMAIKPENLKSLQNFEHFEKKASPYPF